MADANQILARWLNAAAPKNSVAIFNGDGIKKDFDFNFIGGYLAPEHIKAYVFKPGSSSTEDAVGSLTGPNTYTLATAPAADEVLVVYRDTPKDFPLVDFAAGAPLTGDNLDLSARQAVLASGELIDRLRQMADPYSSAAISQATAAPVATAAANLADTVSVRDFGATGDGLTDDTAAIQAADASARAAGAKLIFPAGTFMVSQLVIHSGSNWEGAGRDGTTIKQIIGSNTDLLYGFNSNANWGRLSGNEATSLVVGFTLRSITLDGNWNSGSGNTSGSGIAAYCARPLMRDVFIKNVAEHGMRTEYLDTAAGGVIEPFGMEGHFTNIRIDGTGKHGWLHRGPHDSVITDMIVIDASQASENTYDGINLGTGATGKFVSCHVWTRGWSKRCRRALYCGPESTHEFSGGCHFEGAYTAVVAVEGNQNIFDPSTRIYAAWNGVHLTLGKTCTGNRISGTIGDPGPNRPAAIGLTVGASPTDFVQGNVIDLVVLGNNAALAQFNYSSGYNRIRLSGYQSGGVVFTGTPAATDHIDIKPSGVNATSPYSPGSIAAWATFSVASGVPTLVAGFNVASVSRTDIGQYRVNFATTMKTAVTGALVTSDFGVAPPGIVGYRPYSNDPGYQHVHFRRTDGTFVDPQLATFLFLQS